LFVEHLETRALPSFLTSLHFDTGREPNSVAVGDFNGDGISDLVTANLISNTVSVLLGKGDGTFQPARDFAVGRNPEAVVVGDFDGDHIPEDIAVANTSDNTVSVLLGNGDGTFRLAGNFAVGVQPVAIAAGDFHGDGNTDLVTANMGGNTISVLLGNGDGTFQPARDFSTGPQPDAVAVADFNGDHIPDLVVANTASRFVTVSVLLGNGDGTFQAPRTFPAGNSPADFTSIVQFSPISIAVADFNQDGTDDLAVVSDEGIRLLLGNGDGSFQTRPFSYNAGGGSQSVVAGDFNRDSFPDLAVANVRSGSVFILLNDTVWPPASGPHGQGAARHIRPRGSSAGLAQAERLAAVDALFTGARAESPKPVIIGQPALAAARDAAFSSKGLEAWTPPPAQPAVVDADFRPHRRKRDRAEPADAVGLDPVLLEAL
jgi:hypothetical protein